MVLLLKHSFFVKGFCYLFLENSELLLIKLKFNFEFSKFNVESAKIDNGQTPFSVENFFPLTTLNTLGFKNISQVADPNVMISNILLLVELLPILLMWKQHSTGLSMDSGKANQKDTLKMWKFGWDAVDQMKIRDLPQWKSCRKRDSISMFTIAACLWPILSTLPWIHKVERYRSWTPKRNF